MKEFGSDFHRCESEFCGRLTSGEPTSLTDFYPDAQLYATGRHAIQAVLRHGGWTRIWIPAYFCYEVVADIARTGIQVAFYDDTPLRKDDEQLVRSLPYREGDVLLRMNFFGLRGPRRNQGIPVPVIEDHSHDLLSEWSLQSDADWWVASVRKILPVASGGMLRSPKGHTLPQTVPTTQDCERMAQLRYEAMQGKTAYLEGQLLDKSVFRPKFLRTEDWLGELSLSGMDATSEHIVRHVNLREWTARKQQNREVARQRLAHRWQVLEGEGDSTPFSVVLLCDTAEQRTRLKAHLIEKQIYPAVLWPIPEEVENGAVRDFAERMLSVHCDARYTTSDILHMCNLILEETI